MEVMVRTGAIRFPKLQSECHHQQNNTQFIFTGQMPFLSPSHSVNALKEKWKSAQRDANIARPPQSPHRCTESAMAVVRQSQNFPRHRPPFRGRRTTKILSAGDGHYLHLQTQFGDQCMQFQVIMVTDTARRPPVLPPQTGPIKIHYTAMLSTQCKKHAILKWHKFCESWIRHF